MNHFECADLVKQRIVGQKGELMLKAQGRDPEVVSEPFAFFERIWNGTRFGQIVSDTNVERDCVEICGDHFAAGDQRVNLRSVLLSLPRTGDAESKLGEDEERHE